MTETVRYPMLRSPARPAWRAPGELQVPGPSGAGVVLGGLPPQAAQLLALLDGTREVDELVGAAERSGVDGATVVAVLDTLAEHGLLMDGGRPEGGPAAWGRGAGPSRAGGHGAAAGAADRRAAATVVAHGPPRLAVPVLAVLAASGVGRVHLAGRGRVAPGDCQPGGLTPDDVGRPLRLAVADAVRRADPRASSGPGGRSGVDCVVLAHGRRPDPATLRQLRRARVAFLVCRASGDHATVGPLVRPGVTACPGCIDRHRADADPAWPALAAQAAPGARRAGPHPPPPSTALVARLAGRAGAAVLTALDAGAAGPAGEGGAGWEEQLLPDGTARLDRWWPHPDCGCGAWAAQ